jgi:hypothetical protein
MWRKLRNIALVLAAIVVTPMIAFIISMVVDELQWRRAHAQQEADDRVAYAYAARLRADGDRLAKEGEWEDALARYNQASSFDRGDDDHQKEKLQVIKEHVGEVVWDKEFEAHGSPP